MSTDAITETTTARQQAPTVVERPAQPYVGIRAHITMDTFAVIADRIPEIFGWLAERGVAPAGAPFLRYNTIDMERCLEVEAGVPVAEAVAPSPPVFADTLPAGRYANVNVVGHPDQLLGVTRDLLAWADEQGLQLDHHDSPAGDTWASRLEIFHSNPAEVPDMNEWRTELAFKLAD